MPVIMTTTDAFRAPKPFRYLAKSDEIFVRRDLVEGFANAYERIVGTEETERELLVNAIGIARWRLHMLGASVTIRDTSSISIGVHPIPIPLKRLILADVMLSDIAASAPTQNLPLAIDARVTAVMTAYYLLEGNDPAIADLCLTT